MLTALLFALSVFVKVEPPILLALRRKAGFVVLLEVGILLQLLDHSLHVGSHGRLVAKDELLLIDEALPCLYHKLPLFLSEVALGPLDWSLVVHLYLLFNYSLISTLISN